MKTKNVLNYIPIFLSLFVLLLILPLTVWQITNKQQKQELRGQAATPSGVATFSFSPSSQAVTVSNSVTPRLPVDLKFHTPSSPANLGVTGLKAVFSYNNTALSLTAGDIVLNPTLYNPDPSSPAKWSLVRTEITTTAITIEAVNLYAGSTGWTGATTSPQTLVTLNFSTKAITQNSLDANLVFDTAKSAIYAKADNSDILSSSLTGGSYTIYLDTTPPETNIASSTCPVSPIRTSTITFTFSGSDLKNDGTPGTSTQNLQYSYRQDTGTWSSYSLNTTATLSNLTTGRHTFEVKAMDTVGNIDPTPASCNFTYTPQTNLELRLKFQGLSPTASPPPQHYLKTTNVTVRNASYNPTSAISGTATYNASLGSYISTLSLPISFPGTGIYEVLVKGPWHLRRNLGTTTITYNTDNLLDKNSDLYQLVRGDITGDNFVKLGDITAVISVWVQSETPVTTESMRKYDLTEDGIISISDITAIIANWTSSEREGDK